MNNVYDTCAFCKKEVLDSNMYFIYQVLIITETNTYCFGILPLMQEMNDWLMTRGSHLSASQILLLRPDIAKEFFEKKINEKVTFWFLDETDVCYSCFEKDYVKQVPEK